MYRQLFQNYYDTRENLKIWWFSDKFCITKESLFPDLCILDHSVLVRFKLHWFIEIKLLYYVCLLRFDSVMTLTSTVVQYSTIFIANLQHWSLRLQLPHNLRVTVTTVSAVDHVDKWVTLWNIWLFRWTSVSPNHHIYASPLPWRTSEEAHLKHLNHSRLFMNFNQITTADEKSVFTVHHDKNLNICYKFHGKLSSSGGWSTQNCPYVKVQMHEQKCTSVKAEVLFWRLQIILLKSLTTIY